ncbi:hypothetical protein DENSPDRAFT_788521 [Dentipellis sp. KUC8613]|nr:hypothetical protein DENSPDRAFT_788521 [Dentipellis sp. KUC8613]
MLSPSGAPPKLSQSLSIGTKEAKVAYKLKGIIYLGGNHFTSRIVGSQGEVWYHDGIATKEKCLHEGKLNTIEDIHHVRDRTSCMTIYGIV